MTLAREARAVTLSTPPTAEELSELALACGADDAGLVSIIRPELADQREELLRVFPGTRALLAIVCRMHRAPIRSPMRSAANLEFHHVGDEVGRRVVAALEARGVGALNAAMGFPMEIGRFPGKIWYVAHKPIAEAAGLGRMGVHRNVIHPRFGSFVLLGTVLIDVEPAPEEEARPLDFNPCLECKLCVAACPVGAVGADGAFDFSACYTHNYREFMGGFTDWVETVAGSRSGRDYRRRVRDAESASWWQSLSHGANYKAAYCMAVCPAGEDVIAPFRDDRGRFLREVVKPLQQKVEPVYVVPGTDADAHVRRPLVRERQPHKEPRAVGNSLRPTDVAGFLRGLPYVFQRHKAAEVSVRVHFRFRGADERDATVAIERGVLEVLEGRVGQADVRVHADAASWIAFLRKDAGLVGLLLRRKLRLRGDPRALLRFGRCFP